MVAVRKTHYAALCSLIASIVAAGCGGPTQSASTAASPMQQGMPDMSAPLLAAPSPDPRVGLKAGLQDAGEAIWNVRKVSHTPSPQGFAGITNSDLAFHGTNVIQGNYNGFQIWDISNPTAPRLRESHALPGVAERRLRLQESPLRLGRGADGATRLRERRAARSREQRPHPRAPHLRHHRHRPSEVSRQRADVPRLAHAHGRRRSERQGERLRLHLGHVGDSSVRRAGALQRQPLGPEQLELPHRSHQDPARASGAGGGRELAGDLRRSDHGRQQRSGLSAGSRRVADGHGGQSRDGTVQRGA